MRVLVTRLLLAVACLLPTQPLSSKAAPATAPSPASPAISGIRLPLLPALNTDKHPDTIATTPSAADGRVRMTVNQPYTMQHRRRSSASVGALTDNSSATGSATGSAENTTQVVKADGRIIWVPNRRKPTGCRMNQGLDQRGGCRTRW